MTLRKPRQLDDRRRRSLIAAPVAVLVTMYLVFNALAAFIEPRLALFLGMVVYWLIWCIVFPLWAVGAAELRAALRDVGPRFGEPQWLGLTLLGIPVFLALVTGSLVTWSQATLLIILLTIPFALVNGDARGDAVAGDLCSRLSGRPDPGLPLS